MKKQNSFVSVLLGVLAVIAGIIAQTIGQMIVLIVGMSMDVAQNGVSAILGSGSASSTEISAELMKKPYYSTALIVGELFMFALCFAWYMGAFRKTDVGPAKSVSVKVIGLAVSVALFFQFAITAIMELAFLVLPDFIVEGYNALSQNLSGTLTLGFILMISVLAPITEELLCRGIVFGFLKKGLSTKASIYISALLFGLMHFGNTTNLSTFIGCLFQVTYAFLLGIFLGYIRVKFKSVVPCCFVHIFANASSYLFLLIPASFAYEHEVLTYLLIGLVGAGFAVLAIKLDKKIEPVSALTKAEAALEAYTD